MLVTGAGPIGLVAAQAARAYGATEVVVTDVNPVRLALAERLGATALDVSTASVTDAGFDRTSFWSARAIHARPGTPWKPWRGPAASS